MHGSGSALTPNTHQAIRGTNKYMLNTKARSGKSWWHDDVIKWKHFPRYWPFVRGIHRSSVNSPHKGQWRRALMFSLICARINGWVNNGEAGDLRRHRAHYDVIAMEIFFPNEMLLLFYFVVWAPVGTKPRNYRTPWLIMSSIIRDMGHHNSNHRAPHWL